MTSNVPQGDIADSPIIVEGILLGDLLDSAKRLSLGSCLVIFGILGVFTSAGFLVREATQNPSVETVRLETQRNTLLSDLAAANATVADLQAASGQLSEREVRISELSSGLARETSAREAAETLNTSLAEQNATLLRQVDQLRTFMNQLVAEMP